jgi:hypothetical protein
MRPVDEPVRNVSCEHWKLLVSQPVVVAFILAAGGGGADVLCRAIVVDGATVPTSTQI